MEAHWNSSSSISGIRTQFNNVFHRFDRIYTACIIHLIYLMKARSIKQFMSPSVTQQNTPWSSGATSLMIRSEVRIEVLKLTKTLFFGSAEMKKIKRRSEITRTSRPYFKKYPVGRLPLRTIINPGLPSGPQFGFSIFSCTGEILSAGGSDP